MGSKVLSETFACDGGPHILLPISAVSHWTGMGDNFDPLDQDTDYSRACSIEPPLGLLTVGSGQGLVLAGSPAISAWGEVESGIFNIYIFEEWVSEHLDVVAKAALDHLGVHQLVDTKLRWSISDKALILLFAGDSPGKTIYGEVVIPVAPSTYAIFLGHYDGPEGKLCILQLRSLKDQQTSNSA